MSFIPVGAAYKGATPEILDRAREEAGEAYIPTVFNPGTLTRKGPVRIAKDRVPAKSSLDGQPGFDMYYELHGTGPKRLAFMMGMNNSCFGWLDQVEEFGSDPQYSVLVLDNRGFGNTGAPKMRYKTTDFALDVLEVFEHIGWTQERSINLIGVSLGGMMSLELARMRPELFCTLLLLSTTAGETHSLPPYLGMRTIFLNMVEQIFGFGKPDMRVYRIIDVLFPQEWQDQASEHDPTKTNREIIRPMLLWRFGFTKRPTSHGALSQISAGLTHHVPDEDLVKINESVPHIKILTGDCDNLVHPVHSKHMHQVMPSAEYEVWPGGGHVLHVQWPSRFNAMLRQWAK